MAGYRKDRINGQLQQELSVIIPTVKDYRVSGTLVSITGVDCAADLKTAKVYFSCIGTKEEQDEVRRGLFSATGYIRSQLAQRLNLRITPELRFIADNSMAHGMHISELLHSVEKEMADFAAREAEAAAKAEGKDENADE